MNPTEDPFYELRLYRVEPGRARAMEQRMQEDLRTLFPKHGVRPAGTWTVTAGAAAPLFVYLMPWRSMQERSSAFAGFASDPAWAEARSRTNAGSELVQRYEILFLRALREWSAPPAHARVVELVLQETAQGHGAEVRQAIETVAIPAWERAGAQVCGCFDLMTGPSLPASAFVIAWPDLQARANGQDEVQAKTGGLRSANGTALLQRADQYLMRGVPVDWD